MDRHHEWMEQQDTVEVTIGGHDLTVAYYDEGDGDPVLFLHGIPTWSYLWRDIVPAIADERRVIVPDMVGYGNSSMQDGFDRSLRTQEEMVRQLLDELEIDQFSFVGHDLGGGVALRFAAHEPDRVDELVLSNSVAYDSWPIETIANFGLPATINEMSVEDLQNQLDEIYRQTLYADEPSEDFVEGMKAQWNSDEGRISLSRNAIATNTSHTIEIDPADVTAETLLLWGAEDDFQPIAYAERLRDDISSAQLVGIDEARHWVMQDQPDEYQNELGSFLLDST